MKTHGFKSLSLALCLLMIFSVFFPVPAAAASHDYETHWARETIQSAIASGLSKGYPDGTFKPDNAITRAEFFSLVNNAFNFTTASVDTYTDVAADAWYAPVVARAKAAGYVAGYPDGSIQPNSNITRQEAAFILSKVKVMPAASGNLTFSDASGIATWSRDAIQGIYEAKIMTGYPDGSFKPDLHIKRAEALVAVMNTQLYTGQPPLGSPTIPSDATIYNNSGTYGSQIETTTVDGDVVITAPEVTVQNTIIKGDLTIAKEVGESDITLRSVTVEGMIHVYGGGENSVYFVNVDTGEVHVLKDEGPVRLVVSGTTAIDELSIESDVVLEEADLTTGSGFNGITVENTADGVTVSLVGVDCDSITIEAEDVILDLDEDTSVATLILNGINAEINGEGEIANAEINADGAVFENEPTTMDVASGISQPTISPPSSGGGGGGGGGGGSSNVAVSSITVTGTGVATTIEKDNGTLQMLAEVLPTNATNKTVTWSVADGTGSATITAGGLLTAVADGTVTVTATSVSNGSINDTLEITISNQIRSENEITAFSFDELDVTGVVDGSEITVVVPIGTDVTALIATFATAEGTVVSVDGAAQESGVTPNDFTESVVYTVDTGDGIVATYTVTVVEAPADAKEITEFSFEDPAVTGTIDGTNIDVEVPIGTDVTALVATFTASLGATVTVDGVVQESNVTPNDFTVPVEYVVTAEDLTTATYTVTVSEALADAKEITAFSFADQAAIGTIDGANITVEVPADTDVTALVATFTASPGASVTVDGVAQESGITPNDFTNPVNYVVTAEDLTTATYTVTVSEAGSDAKEITAFSFTNPAAAGTINGTAIAVEVPAGTDVTTLVATFTASPGASVTVGGVAQDSGVTPNDFTSPVEYVVTAEDLSTETYTVTVTEAVPTAAEITAFSFTDPAATGTIDGTAIAVEVPEGTVLTALIANFTASAGAVVTVDGVAQESGVTANDFTNPVAYTVTAEDSTAVVYTVTVTEAPSVWTVAPNGEGVRITGYTGPAGDVVIPAVIAGDPVNSIGNRVFMGMAVTTVAIPETVTSIGDFAFQDCASLTEITIHEGVESIGQQAFNRCVLLESVIVPDSVTTLGIGAFNGCSALTSVTLSNALTEIGELAFNNTAIDNITLHEGLTSIGPEAFAGTNLTAVTLPESLATIGELAFVATPLTEIVIGADVTIEDNALAEDNLFREAYGVGGAGTYIYADSVWTKDGAGGLGEAALTTSVLPEITETIEEPALEEEPEPTEVVAEEDASPVPDALPEEEFQEDAEEPETTEDAETTVDDGSVEPEQE